MISDIVVASHECLDMVVFGLVHGLYTQDLNTVKMMIPLYWLYFWQTVASFLTFWSIRSWIHTKAGGEEECLDSVMKKKGVAVDLYYHRLRRWWIGHPRFGSLENDRWQFFAGHWRKRSVAIPDIIDHYRWVSSIEICTRHEWDRWWWGTKKGFRRRTSPSYIFVERTENRG